MREGRFGAALGRAVLVPAILAAVVVLGSLVAGLALADARPLVLHGAVVALGGLGLWAGIALLDAALPGAPSLLRRALPQRPPRPAPPEELERLRRAVSFASSSGFDFHVRMRPRLREIAAQRLLARRGIDLDRQPDAVRRALGPAGWDAVHGDPPPDRMAPGPPAAALRGMLDALEDL
jgi:hypothetical protein